MLTQAHEIVDLSKIKKLNDNHLKIHLKYHNKETDPVMYGNKFPYGTASKPTLVDRKDIKWRGGRFQTYQSRLGNGNPAHKMPTISIIYGIINRLNFASGEQTTRLFAPEVKAIRVGQRDWKGMWNGDLLRSAQQEPNAPMSARPRSN